MSFPVEMLSWVALRTPAPAGTGPDLRPQSRGLPPYGPQHLSRLQPPSGPRGPCMVMRTSSSLCPRGALLSSRVDWIGACVCGGWTANPQLGRKRLGKAFRSSSGGCWGGLGGREETLDSRNFRLQSLSCEGGRCNRRMSVGRCNT